MKKVLFYCSWGGFGHIARAYSVSKYMDWAKITVASPQRWIFPKSPNLEYIPLTEPKSRFRLEGEKVILQNYEGKADVEGYRAHIFEYYDVLRKVDPDLVIVDNPAEIALFTKMLGYKTCVVWETLESNDLRWRLVWGNVDKVLVPYSKRFADDLDFKFAKNAFFSGGYNRFEGDKLPSREAARKQLGLIESDKMVFVTIGKGRVGQTYIPEIISQLQKNDKYKVYFPYFTKDSWSEGLAKKFKRLNVIHGETDLVKYFVSSDLIVTGAGYNSMMEALYFKIPTILFPLERIYGEQSNKAMTAQKMGAAEMVSLSQDDWPKKFEEAIEKLSMKELNRNIAKAQREVVDGGGAKRTADFIKEII